MGHVMIHNTRGVEDVERASLSFVVANTALAGGQEATVLLTIEGVRLPVKGSIDGLQAHGFQPLSELMHNFVANGGNLWVCGACANPRQIGADDLIDGAAVVGAATAVEALVTGAQTISF